jgi:hypothetical protein
VGWFFVESQSIHRVGKGGGAIFATRTKFGGIPFLT